MIKDKKNKKVRNETKELELKLKEKGVSEENIEKIICYCERLVDLELQKE